MTDTQANSMQIGGDHYASEFQHWDLIEMSGIGYLEAAATKYVSRWRQKGGVQDLRKAVHYTQKLMELHLAGQRPPRGVASSESVHRFIQANNLEVLEARIVALLTQWSCKEDLGRALIVLDTLIQRAKKEEVSSGCVSGKVRKPRVGSITLDNPGSNQALFRNILSMSHGFNSNSILRALASAVGEVLYQVDQVQPEVTEDLYEAFGRMVTTYWDTRTSRQAGGEAEEESDDGE